jgi:hypothetical protein
MQHNSRAARCLQVDAVIGSMVYVYAEMKQQRFHVVHTQIMVQGMGKECMQCAFMLLFHHLAVRAISNLWMLMRLGDSLQLASTDARQLLSLL